MQESFIKKGKKYKQKKLQVTQTNIKINRQAYLSNDMNNMFSEERNNNQHKADHRNSPCWSVLQWTFIIIWLWNVLAHHGSKTLRKFTMKCWGNNGGNYCRDDDIHNKIIAASICKFFCSMCRESTVVVYIESRKESSLRLQILILRLQMRQRR